MPCNLVAVIVVELQITDAGELRNNAPALEAFRNALKQWFQTDIGVQIMNANTPRVRTVFEIDWNRRVEITPDGVQLYGSFTPSERAKIKDFLDGLCAAAAEEKLVVALATQLPLISDEPVFNDEQIAVGRVLTIRL